MPRAVFIMGPTASGKSELALTLAARLDAEIVSVDSALVYRGMDIGTAKPDPATRARVPHHLIDILEPTEAYSAGEFVRDARAALAGIFARGRPALLVGGTMLYFQALSEGIGALPHADPAVRAQLDSEARERGWAALHAELAAVDPAAAARIHVNDPQRIQRALEVHRLTGRAISDLRARRGGGLEGVEVTEIALAPAQRAVLHARIAARFRAMLDAGFLDEVARLVARADLSAEHPSMRAVGYRQMWPVLQGRATLEEGTERAIAATRQLAKRQLTWLKKRERAIWLDPTAAGWIERAEQLARA